MVMPGHRITQAQIEHYWMLRSRDFSVARAAKEAGFSEGSAKSMERIRKANKNGSHGNDPTVVRAAARGLVPDYPVNPVHWAKEARAAMNDQSGALFMKRYMGFELSKWQQIFWKELEDAYASQDREYLVTNAPPGLGKSTVLVGFAAKQTALDRSLRGLFMSRAHSLAEKNTMRLRRALERTEPFTSATATLAGDFGRFRARQGEVWRKSEFVVEQFDGELIEEKEPTWAAFGFDSEWLGNRLNIVFGDDLDSGRTVHNMEIVENNRRIFDTELEPRVEPGGLMCIAQQRLGSFDFSAHALGKVLLPDDDGVTENPEGELQYRQIIYKAHYDELCKGVDTHKAGSPGWPDGCLLDPRRLPYRDLRKAMRNRRTYRVVYQQEDLLGDEALVNELWVNGGTDPQTQENFIGCWDEDRDAWELPVLAMEPPVIGVITVDPSPTKYWAIEAWAWHPATKQRFLLDLHRDKMEAPDFLDWATGLNCFAGVLEDWSQNFAKMGLPLSHVIVEINAAQRFMLQYEHFHRWRRERNVEIIAHSTQRNKADSDFGIQMLAPVWRHGQVRLPGRGHGRQAAMHLVTEVLRYNAETLHGTDDCVLAEWFLEFNLDRLFIPGAELAQGKKSRPSWLGKSSLYPART